MTAITRSVVSNHIYCFIILHIMIIRGVVSNNFNSPTNVVEIGLSLWSGESGEARPAPRVLQKIKNKN